MTGPRRFQRAGPGSPGPARAGARWLTPGRKAALAVLLVVAMLASTVPMVTGDTPPDLSNVQLGELEEGECLTLELDPATFLGILQEMDPENASASLADNVTRAVEGDGGGDGEGGDADDGTTPVPMICGVGAEPVYGQLIETGNTVLRLLGQGLAAVDDQIDAHSPVATLAFLVEDFTEPRVGGIGSWQVRTAGDDNTGLRRPVDRTVADGYALADQPGDTYEHALNTTLISPAIDLGGVAIDPAVATLPTRMRDVVRAGLPAQPPLSQEEGEEEGTSVEGCTTLNVLFLSIGGQGTGLEPTCLSDVVGDQGVLDTYRLVRQAYLDTADTLITQFVEANSAATLELRHRFNLADGLDGVRYEVLTEAPPERGLPPVGDVLEPREGSAGQGHGDVAAFNGRPGFTGSSEGWTTESFDLTPYAGERIWIVTRARTDPAFGLDDFFRDPTLFPSQAHQGYGLDGVYVNATAHRYNLRILDVDGGGTDIDGRPTVPPPLADQRVRITVTNQGLEPADTRVLLDQCRRERCLAEPVVVAAPRLEPGEVATVEAPYPNPDVGTGVLTLRTTIEHAGDERTTGFLEATPDDNALRTVLAVQRVARLTVEATGAKALGLAVSPPDGGVQDPRKVRLEVRNTGNVPVSGSVLLGVQDVESGSRHDTFIQDAAEKPLSLAPGSSTTRTWTVIPSEAGIFRLRAQFLAQAEVVGFPEPAAHLFVERSPGVVCADDLASVRTCTEAWALATQLPGGAFQAVQGAFVAATKADDGSLYAAAGNGTVYRFQGDGWNVVARGTPVQHLVTSKAGVVGIGIGGDVRFFDRSGQRAGSPVPLATVEAVTVGPDGRIAVAGSGPQRQGPNATGPVGVAVGDGGTWELFTSPSDDLPQGSLSLHGIAPLADGTYTVALVHERDAEDGGGTFALACVVDGSFAKDRAFACLTNRPRMTTNGERDGTDPGAVQVPDQVAGRDAFVGIGSVGNWSILFVESPIVPANHVPFGTCEAERQTRPTALAGDVCAYRVVADQVVKDPIRPIHFRANDQLATFTLESRYDDARDHLVWRGASAGIRGEVNPTLELEAGERVRITIKHGSPSQCNGMRDDQPHNLTVRHPDGTIVRAESGAPLTGGALRVTCGASRTTATFRLTQPGTYTYESLQPDDGPMHGTIDVTSTAPFAQSAAGTSWLVDAASRHPDTRGLLRVIDQRGAPALVPAVIPVKRPITAIGTGVDTAVAIAGNQLLTAVDPPSYLVNEQDWRNVMTLGPIKGDRVWSNTEHAFDPTRSTNPDNIERFTEVRGPRDWQFLRGSCAASRLAGETAGASVYDVSGCITLPASSGTPDPSGELGDELADTVGPASDFVSEPGPDEVNVTLRYAMQQRGLGTPQVRVFIEPAAAVKTIVLPGQLSTAPIPVDGEGERDPGSLLRSLFIAVQDAVNEGLPGGAGDMSDSFGPSGNLVTINGSVDEDERFTALDELGGVRSPHVVHVAPLEGATGDHWRTLEISLTEALEPYRRTWGQVRLVGVEVAMPPRSQIAVDAMWLNITQPFEDRPETLLHTDGRAGPQGTWVGLGFDTRSVPSAFENHPNFIDGFHVPTWSASRVTHRPAWAFMGPADNDFTFQIGDSGHAKGRMDRLVTPVVDLRDATDPVLTFQHAYAMDLLSSGGVAGGFWVEAQREIAPGQWSSWTKVRPEGGYPTLEDHSDEPDPGMWTGVSVMLDRDQAYRDILDPDHWDEATFDLLNQTVPIVGKRVRFALTGLASLGTVTKDWKPYEGWIVSDITVRAADRPAIDLELADAQLDEGFDVSATGLAPGSQVTLNVTVTNRGTLESLGGLVRWELVQVGLDERVVARGATPLATLQPGRTTWLELPVAVPKLASGAADEAPGVYMRVRIDPAGTPDEDPTNNDLTIGGPVNPFRVREQQGLQVRLDVAPPVGAPARVRALNVELFNEGNVPLSSIEVRRTVALEQGVTGRQVLSDEVRTYTTDRELAAGVTQPLSALVDGFPLDDRFWTPGRDGTFVVTVQATADGLARRTDVAVVALDPYLLSTVEDPPQGIGFDGDFDGGDSWTIGGPGAFGSPKAFQLAVDGSNVSADGAELVLDFPDVDLSVAKVATASFYHRYDFEQGFDGGRLEVSRDGGRTWLAVPPVDQKGAGAYGDVLGGNPLARGNVSAPAFTGNGTASPQAGADGYVLSTFDLLSLPGLLEPGEVETFDLENLAGNSSRRASAPASAERTTHVYTHPTWSRGSVAASRVFMVENLTEDLEDRGAPGFAFTGELDELEEAGQNYALRYDIDVPLDARAVEELGQRAELTWWEWSPITSGEEVVPASPGTLGALYLSDTVWGKSVYIEGDQDARCADSRFPIKLLRIDGHWRKYGVNVTPAVTDGDGEATLLFMLTPWSRSNQLAPYTFGDSLRGLPGLLVDGVEVRTFTDHVSGELGVQRRDVSPADGQRAGFLGGDCTTWEFQGLGNDDGEPMRDVDSIKAPRAAWSAVELPNEDQGRVVALSSSPLRDERPHVYNVTPYSDTRLVVPAIDLGTAGDNITLTFDHLPMFYYHSPSGAGGGTVEVSIWDPVRSEWGAWDQLYSKPEQLGNWEKRTTPTGGKEYVHDYTGGYGTWLTAVRQLPPLNASTQAKLQAGSDLSTYPFDHHDGDPEGLTGHPGGHLANSREGQQHQVVYAYNWCGQEKQGGDAVSCEDIARPDTWLNASYNLSGFSGERIRIAFHALHRDECSYEKAYEAHPDSNDADEQLGDASTEPGHQSYVTGCPVDGERWLLDNVTIHGQAFAGAPVKMRLVAGLDGSVHDAEWLVDEIEVQGTAYRRNVGLYLDDGDLPQLAPGATATITGQVRNLGTEVRRDLAVRAVVEGASTELVTDVQAVPRATGTDELTTDPFTLQPSSSRRVTFNITLPDPDATIDVLDVALEIVQWNELLGIHTNVPGEEVRTNLLRDIDLNVTRGGLAVESLEALPARLVGPGKTVITAELENPSPEGVTVDLTCTVERVRSWRAIGHGTRGAVDEPITDLSVPCEPRTPGPLTLARDTAVRRYDVHLDEPGAYHVKLVGRDVAKDLDILEQSTTVWLGDGPLRIFESFEAEEGDFTGDFEGPWRTESRFSPEGDSWGSGFAGFATTEEARRGNWSWLNGIPRSSYADGGTYATSVGRRLVTPPVDLHNVTTGEATFSMYHMLRLAKGDGADVRARVLVNEGSAASGDAGWTDWCVLEPIGGYDGYVASFHVDSAAFEQEDGGPLDREGNQEEQEDPPPTDYNNAFLVPGPFPTGIYKEFGYFGSHDDPVFGTVPRWDEAWVLDVFPLGHDPANGTALDCQGEPFIGRTVQFAMALYTGRADSPNNPNDDPLVRGRGQGWFLDSVVVSGARVEGAPHEVHAIILDNATKRFPLFLDNQGPATEKALVRVDHANSTVTAREAVADVDVLIEPNTSAVGFTEVTIPRDPLALPFRHTVVVRAQELIDPNQEPTTILNLNFDPRVWPDLAATLLDPSEPPVEGVPSVIPVQVTNHGRAAAKPTHLLFRDTFGNETTEQRIEVPRLPAPSKDPLAATTVVFVPWTPERGTAGEHRLEVILDPDQALEQYTRVDDTVSRRVDVQRLLIPDLRFDEANITLESASDDVVAEHRGTVTTYTATAGTLVTLTAPVTNAGTATATNVDVRLFLGSVVLPAKRVARLEPGETATLSFTFLAQEGAHELSLETSSSSRDLVPEDNRAPLVGALRLLASTFRVEATLPETVTTELPGTIDDVALVLENKGAVGVLLDVRAETPRGITYRPDTDQLFLGAGERVELPGRVTVDPTTDGGTHHVLVTVLDHDQPGTRVEVPLGVHLAERHELTVELVDTSVLAGPGTLVVTLTNDGNLPEALTLRPLIDGDPVGPAGLATVPRDAQRTVRLELDVPHTTAPGPHTLTLALNGTLEATRELAIDVAAKARPILEPLLERQAFTPDGLVVPVRVTNAGNIAYDGAVTPDPTTGLEGARVEPSTLTLEPGQARLVELKVPANTLDDERGAARTTADAPTNAPIDIDADADADADVGGAGAGATGPRAAAQAARTVRLTASGDGSAAGATETSFELTRNRPDARVLRHALTPQLAAAGEPTELVVTVGNSGPVAAKDVPVELFIDDEFAIRAVLDELVPGGSRTVSFEWPAFAGNHVASVVIDPGARVPDAALANNAITVAVQADDGAMTLTRLIEDVREVPGPGLSLIVLALAAALLVLRRRGGPGPASAAARRGAHDPRGRAGATGTTGTPDPTDRTDRTNWTDRAARAHRTARAATSPRDATNLPSGGVGWEGRPR